VRVRSTLTSAVPAHEKLPVTSNRSLLRRLQDVHGGVGGCDHGKSRKNAPLAAHIVHCSVVGEALEHDICDPPVQASFYEWEGVATLDDGFGRCFMNAVGEQMFENQNVVAAQFFTGRRDGARWNP
jgi:hypothetical protein